MGKFTAKTKQFVDIVPDFPARCAHCGHRLNTANIFIEFFKRVLEEIYSGYEVNIPQVCKVKVLVWERKKAKRGIALVPRIKAYKTQRERLEALWKK